MKKLLCAVICAATLLGALPARAATGDQATIQQVVGALGIISGDSSGSLNLSGNVTRAEFAKMLVSASTLKDTVSPAGNASPFYDVPYTHWAASYIKTAVSQGWLTGYLDGAYRPENTVSAAEAATAVLRLLGYSSADFSGAFPAGQMALYESLGLGDGLSLSADSTMSRQSCMRLFYNLLSVKSKDSEQKYVEKLGYKLDANGNPDVNDLLQSTMDGPAVLRGSVQDTVGFTPATVYRNGASATLAELSAYDVLYYSASRSTVWAYTRRVTGIYASASPNKDAPVSITVAGVTYNVTDSGASAQLGSEGGLAIGSNITVLLGKDGDVVAAYAAEELAGDITGLVTATSKETYTSANGASYTQNTLTVLAADGQTYKVQSSKSFSAGDLVRASYGSTETVVTRLSKNSLSGKATAAGIGTKSFAPDVKIMDVTGSTGKQVYPARLAGMTVQSGDVYFYELNSAGQIETLILNDATGDCYNYGIVTSARIDQGENDFTSSYSFLVDGQSTSVNLNGTHLNVSAGPAKLLMEGGGVTRAYALTELKNITGLTSLTVRNADESHTIWDRAAVYVQKNGSYTQLSLDALNLDDYNIRAYYDEDDAQGGRVRLIIATERN